MAQAKGSQKKRGKWNILFIVFMVTILFVYLLPIIIFAYITAIPNYKPKLEKAFNTISLPPQYQLIESKMGNEGHEGSPSLTRSYKINGRRKKIIKDLQEILKKSGYEIMKDDPYFIYDNDYYHALSKNREIDIYLYPQDRSVGKKYEEVKEIKFTLY